MKIEEVYQQLEFANGQHGVPHDDNWDPACLRCKAELWLESHAREMAVALTITRADRKPNEAADYLRALAQRLLEYPTDNYKEAHEALLASADDTEALTRAERQLVEQRAELEGRMSEEFRSLPSRYDTPEDHYREMARRFCEDRDEKKHEVRKLTAALVGLSRGDQCWCDLAIGNPMMSSHSRACEAARAALAPKSVS